MGEFDKTAVTQTENVSDTPRRRGCAAHCAKFWWAHLITTVVLTAIITPVLLLVAVPKIAQAKIDDAELILNRITVSNAQSNTMTMDIDSTIKTDGSVHANIDGFPGVMYLEDHPDQTPFARIDFPPTTAAKHQSVKVNQLIEIDAPALTIFNKWLVANESLRVTVLGETHVKVKGLTKSYPVTFKKTITMPGLDLLHGTVVNQTRIDTEKDARGNNFFGKTYIPNRSLLAIELGNLTYHNYLLDNEIGTVYIDNVTLEPGMNVYDMRATIDGLADVLGALGKKPYCEDGILPFKIRAKDVVNNGQALHYYRDSLAVHNQTIPIDIGTPLHKHIPTWSLKC